MELFLGIDVGGTTIKFGIVNQNGELQQKFKIPTNTLRENGNFIDEFTKTITQQLALHPSIQKVGIAVPGTISIDRKYTLEMANIPEFNNVPLIDLLEKENPNISFFLENDANAAALGEYYFSKNQMPENFIFITLGTGLGSAAVINGKIFKGGDGNGMEVGHIVTGNGKTAEQNTGKKALVKNTIKRIKKGKTQTNLTKKLAKDAKNIVLAAKSGDPVAVKVFEEVGHVLGEALVSTVRILDIKNIIIGGGVSKIFDIIKHNMDNVLEDRLTKYYTTDLDIKLATLGNDAGIVGAASLCFIQ